jgi:hypothetical protein
MNARMKPIDVIRPPDGYSELACMRDSEITLASLAIHPQNGGYWKVVCTEIIASAIDHR